MDLEIICGRFRSSQPPVFLEVITIASLTWEMSAIIPQTLQKEELTYQLPFKGHFMRSFVAAKASLVLLNFRNLSTIFFP